MNTFAVLGKIYPSHLGLDGYGHLLTDAVSRLGLNALHRYPEDESSLSG